MLYVHVAALAGQCDSLHILKHETMKHVHAVLIEQSLELASFESNVPVLHPPSFPPLGANTTSNRTIGILKKDT